jgi:hypothetical protein
VVRERGEERAVNAIIEAVTVVRYRVANPPKGWRRRGLRATRALAYRDAAWAKIRSRCECYHPQFDARGDLATPGEACRFHNHEYRADPETCEDPATFRPPAVWRLPRAREDGFWDYGRAVAFRLARLYRHLDARSKAGEVAARTPSASAPHAAEPLGNQHLKPEGM